MLEIDIPGRGKMRIENIVFDFNGTLAVDGKLNTKVIGEIIRVNKFLKVYILTADLYGTVQKQCAELDVNIKIFSGENTSVEKNKIVNKLGKEKSIVIGNGFNDILMMKNSILSIAVIGKEGASSQVLTCSDIVVNNIVDVFDMVHNTDRIRATLRA